MPGASSIRSMWCDAANRAVDQVRRRVQNETLGMAHGPLLTSPSVSFSFLDERGDLGGVVGEHAPPKVWHSAVLGSIEPASYRFAIFSASGLRKALRRVVVTTPHRGHVCLVRGSIHPAEGLTSAKPHPWHVSDRMGVPCARAR